MKIVTKKIIMLLLSAIIIFSAIPAVRVNAATQIRYDKKKYTYYNPNSKENYAYIEITGLKKSQRVKAVKSSDKSVAKIAAVNQHYYSSKTIKVAKDSVVYNWNEGSASIKIKVLKKGKTTVSFKIGSKTYKTKVYCMKWTMPIKSLKITGINKNKNIVNKLQSSWSTASSAYLDNAYVSSARIKTTPNSGWKVTEISVTNDTTGYGRSLSRSAGIKSYVYGKLIKKNNYRINIVLTDKYKNTYSVDVNLRAPENIK